MTKSSSIPDHMITDILPWLPVKSLLRLKIVCKLWYSLISNPNFINLHSDPASQNPKILFATEHFQVRILDAESLIFDESCLSPAYNFPLKSHLKDDYFHILGSSHGLVCVLLRKRIEKCRNGLYLWNPLTRELTEIPISAPFDIGRFASNAHGFGHDPVSNDFKLFVSIFRTCYIFSVKSNSWKSITCPPNLNSYGNTLARYGEATVINGVFHWLKKEYGGSNLEIIAFDSTEDKFLNLPIPNVASGSPFAYCDSCLLVHKGCLCMYFSMCEPERAEEILMWKNNAWNPFLCISSDYIHQIGGQIYISRSGTQVIFHNARRVVRYSTENGKFDEIRTYLLTIFESTMYVETLISPNHIIGLHH